MKQYDSRLISVAGELNIAVQKYDGGAKTVHSGADPQRQRF